jgi:hypothetical protein
MGCSSGAAPGSSKKKNKKNRRLDKPRPEGPVAAAAVAGGQSSRGKRPCQQRSDPGSCRVHPGACHSPTECREIQKLMERLRKRCD